MFFYFAIIMLLFIIIISTSKITIKVNNIRISTEKKKGRHINSDYKIIVYWNIFSKIRLLKINVTRKKIKELKLKQKIKDLDKKIIEEKFRVDKEILKEIKNLNIKINYLDLKINIGTEDAGLTSYIVAIVSSIIGIVLRNHLQNKQKNRFIVTPIYINKNLLDLEFNCIFSVKLIHIIHIIYILRKRGKDNNVRTSNRRSYGYSYE